MKVADKPNRVETILIIKVAAEFYDDEASEETIRSCVEQDLKDAGYEVIKIV